jgi:hypothetical protein
MFIFVIFLLSIQLKYICVENTPTSITRKSLNEYWKVVNMQDNCQKRAFLYIFPFIQKINLTVVM